MDHVTLDVSGTTENIHDRRRTKSLKRVNYFNKFTCRAKSVSCSFIFSSGTNYQNVKEAVFIP